MGVGAIVLTLVGYIALLFVVAWRASRNTDNNTFFTGGRATHHIVASIAMVGAAMSGVTYISVPGTVAADGFSYLQTCAGFFVGYVVIAFVLVPLYYRMGVVSLYEYLDRRFGAVACSTGAWFFFVAKILSASLRAFVICVVLQGLLYDKLGVPFGVNALVMMLFVWLYTRRGGVKSVVWVEMLKTIIMVCSIVVCIGLVIKALGLDLGGAVRAIVDSDYSQVLFADNPLDRRYFWKQFVAGAFLVIAMTGLDQDMMQTVLSCRSREDAQRGLLSSIVVQIVVITLFLSLGALLYLYVDNQGVSVARGDDLFGFVAIECGLPAIAGILFLLGLVASTYSSAGSALTALTTSFTIDILKLRKRYDVATVEGGNAVARYRKWVHAFVALVMTGIIICFGRWSEGGAITLIFTMASYTYGPLLALFSFGLFTKRLLRSWAIPVVSLLSPILSYVVATHSNSWLGGYEFSYEILIINAAIAFVGLYLASHRSSK
ncbi:MAG: sodium:solute symporter [Alistipes sp.]|nr:sodium:solute symporter [Alistipes sp.]